MCIICVLYALHLVLCTFDIVIFVRIKSIFFMDFCVSCLSSVYCMHCMIRIFCCQFCIDSIRGSNDLHDTSVMSICLLVLHALYVLFYEYRIVCILHVVYIFGLIGYCCCLHMYDDCMKYLLQFVLPVVYIAVLHRLWPLYCICRYVVVICMAFIAHSQTSI